ncbi:MAG: glycosyltransferase family 4 protein, partial [Acidimicrobiales bacterium]|nr:glycosyltransferase family 4 protein [Acidimicrobiales bacterium]
FATASRMAEWLVERPEPLVLNHHSLTPPEAFAPWNAAIARGQAAAQRELAVLASRADLGVAVSRFDAGELERAGCRRVAVVPVAGTTAPAEPDPATSSRLRRHRPAGSAWLSVGRLAPNKGHERAIAALLAAHRTSDPEARLTVIGAPSEPHYAAALRSFAGRLGLGGAVSFVTGLREEELASYYRESDVLVMLSEHEGFGVPLVEAMAQGLPVVAYRAGAVAETAGDAALLLDGRGPRRVADAVAGLLSDDQARDRLVAHGHRRVAELGLDGAASRFVDLVVTLGARSGAGAAPDEHDHGGAPEADAAAPSSRQKPW